MPQLFGAEVSPDTYELNKHMLTPAKVDKTDARKQLEAEMKQQFARQFEAQWALLGGPALEKEHYFNPDRKWHSDYLHRPTMTLIELEGGAYSGGRHTRPKGFIEDIFKYNSATMLGYRVIRVGTGMVTAHYLQQIIDAIRCSE